MRLDSTRVARSGTRDRPPMKDLKHASARGVAWNMVQNLVSRALGLIVLAIIGRILDRSAFGSIALALAITTFAELLVNGGYGEFITQRPDLEDEHLDTAFWFNFVIGSVLAGVIAITAEPLAAAFAEPSVAPVIRWLALSLLIRSLTVVPTGLLIRKLRFRSLSLRSVVASAVGGTAGIIAALSGLGVYSLVIQVLVGDVVATAILWGATEWRPGLRVSRKHLRELSTFGTPIIGGTILAFVSRRLDTMIVIGALGLLALGVYSIAQRVYQIVLQILNKSTVDVAFSALSRLADSEDQRRRAFYRVIELTGVLCFPTYVGLAIVAEPLTVSLFGARWADSAPALSFFALSGLPFSLSLIHGAAIKSAARTRFLLLINIILFAVYMPIMIVIVSRGTTAAAAASLISCCAIVPVEIGLLRSAMSIRIADYLKALVGPALATIVMAGVTLAAAMATLPPILLLGVECLAGVISYVAALRLLAPATFQRCRELALSTFRGGSAKASGAGAAELDASGDESARP